MLQATIGLSIVFWTFFAQTSSAIANHLLWGTTLLSRIYVPRTVFALSATVTGLINFAISLVPLFAIALPALTYMLVAGMWLIMLVAGSPLTGRR